MLFLDVGANVEVRAQHLVQFAFLGAAFIDAVHGVEQPRVGLLTAARRPGRAARRSSRRTACGRGAGSSSPATSRAPTCRPRADVVVTDGFTGNVALKTSRASKAAAGAISTRSARPLRRWAGCC